MYGTLLAFVSIQLAGVVGGVLIGLLMITPFRVLLSLARKIRGVFRFRYRHKSPRVVQVQC